MSIIGSQLFSGAALAACLLAAGCQRGPTYLESLQTWEIAVKELNFAEDAYKNALQYRETLSAAIERDPKNHPNGKAELAKEDRNVKEWEEEIEDCKNRRLYAGRVRREIELREGRNSKQPESAKN